MTAYSPRIAPDQLARLEVIMKARTHSYTSNTPRVHLKYTLLNTHSQTHVRNTHASTCTHSYTSHARAYTHSHTCTHHTCKRKYALLHLTYTRIHTHTHIHKYATTCKHIHTHTHKSTQALPSAPSLGTERCTLLTAAVAAPAARYTPLLTHTALQ